MVERMANRRHYLWLALGIAFLVALWLQYPQLIDPYSVEEDFRNFYWMHRFQNPELFVNDPTIYGRVATITIGSVQLVMDTGSPLYSLLFQLMSSLISPVLLSKLLVFPLLLTAVYYMYRLGETLQGPEAGLAAALAFVSLNLASHTSISVLGGLQRSFVTPLLLGIVYHVLKEQWKAAAIFLLLGGLIYPPVFMVGAVTYGLMCLRWQPQRRMPLVIKWRQLIPLLIVSMLVALILLPVTLSGLSYTATTGDAAAAESSTFILNDPLYQSGGRFAFFTLFPLVGRGGMMADGVEFAHILFLFGMTLWFFKMKPAILYELPLALKSFFLAGLLCYFLSWASILLTSSFILYLPSRFTQATFFLFGLIVVASYLREGLSLAARWVASQRKRMTWMAAPLLGIGVLILVLPASPANPFLRSTTSRGLLLGLLVTCVGLLILLQRRQPATLRDSTIPKPTSRRTWIILGCLLFVLSLVYVRQMVSGFYRATEEERELFTYLETLPEGVLIAGDPCTLDSVPFFAKRQVLFSCERPHPDPEVIYETLEVYYASTWEPIAQFCQKHGIEYLVINKSDFEPRHIAQGFYFFEPYDSQLAPTIQSQPQFVLNELSPTQYLFETKAVFVMRCTPEL